MTGPGASYAGGHRRRLAAMLAAISLGAAVLGVVPATASAATGSPYAVTGQVGVGTPRDVVFDPSTHNLFASDNASSSVSVIDESGDAKTGKVTTTVAVVGIPDALALDPATHNVYVATIIDPDGGVRGDSISGVSVIDESGDANTGKITAVTDLEGEIVAMTVDPVTHNLYVIATVKEGLAQDLSVIDESGDANTGQVLSTLDVIGVFYALSAPSGIAFDPVTRDAYISFRSGALAVIDESGDSNSGQISTVVRLPTPARVANPGGFSPWAVTFDPSTQNVYLASGEFGVTEDEVSVFDTVTETITGTTDFPAVGYPVAMGLDPSTHDLYLASTNFYDLQLSAIDESGDANNGKVLGSLELKGALPGALTVDSGTHDVFVTDMKNQRVLTLNASGAIGGMITDGSSGQGIAGACVQVETASTGVRVAEFAADSTGMYSGTVAPGSYKLIAGDCLGDTHATTYYGGADNYQFLSPLAETVTVTKGSVQTNLNIALPLAGTISGNITDSSTSLGIAGVCSYAIDTTTKQMRGFSSPSDTSGRYRVAGLPPGTDQIVFQLCSTGPYPLTYSIPVTVAAGRVVTVNERLVHF